MAARSELGATVYNAIDLGDDHFRAEPGDYLVFLGRISPEKRPDRAIEIAHGVGMLLLIAAKVVAVDQPYDEHPIQPLIKANRGFIEYLGEVNDREKDELLGEAYAYLFPIDWMGASIGQSSRRRESEARCHSLSRLGDPRLIVISSAAT